MRSRIQLVSSKVIGPGSASCTSGREAPAPAWWWWWSSTVSLTLPALLPDRTTFPYQKAPEHAPEQLLKMVQLLRSGGTRMRRPSPIERINTKREMKRHRGKEEEEEGD
jgi:hypothetical protein